MTDTQQHNAEVRDSWHHPRRCYCGDPDCLLCEDCLQSWPCEHAQQQRREGLRRLTQMSQDMGLYDTPPGPRSPEVQRYIATLEAENARLSDAWFADETIAPDGELRP